MRGRIGVTCVLLAALVGGDAFGGDARPAFVDALIARLKAAPKKNPPAKVWEYRYRDQLVYYVPPSCCDVPGVLYDRNGAAICSPDGGMTGDGDGRCTDFFDRRTAQRLVWADTR